jgi:DNA-binding NarL/FixJ family response regulator
MAVVTTRAIRVYVAEDKDVIRAGLGQLIQQIPDAEVVGTAADGETALKEILDKDVTVALVKDELPGIDGVTLVQRLKRERPNIGTILMLNQPSEFWYGLSAKADGYFFREVSAEILEPAIRTVATGGAYIGSVLADYLIRGEGYAMLRQSQPRKASTSVTANLSVREKEVLGLLSLGKSNELIAKDLGLSIQTVKVHVKHILKKMGVSDRTQAVIRALTAR